MTIKDLIEREKANATEILLWKEGCFYRAYNYSAMRFVIHIKAIKVLTKHVKYLKEDIFYCGFPESRMAAVEEICKKHNFSLIKNEVCIKIKGINCVQEDFARWAKGYEGARLEPCAKVKKKSATHSIAPVVEKHYDLIKWMLSKIGKFPKDQRFLLADRIERYLLEVLELLIAAMYNPVDRRQLLVKVNFKLDVLRFLMRLSKDMRYINVKAYHYFCRQIVEIGRMVGGWLKVSSDVSHKKESRIPVFMDAGSGTL